MFGTPQLDQDRENVRIPFLVPDVAKQLVVEIISMPQAAIPEHDAEGSQKEEARASKYRRKHT